MEHNTHSSNRHRVWASLWKRAIVVVLGILMGALLAILTASVLINRYASSSMA
jgi:uncharacterized protein involved in exopolysaccharide biosynthesis